MTHIDLTESSMFNWFESDSTTAIAQSDRHTVLVTKVPYTDTTIGLYANPLYGNNFDVLDWLKSWGVYHKPTQKWIQASEAKYYCPSEKAIRDDSIDKEITSAINAALLVYCDSHPAKINAVKLSGVWANSVDSFSLDIATNCAISTYFKEMSPTFAMDFDIDYPEIIAYLDDPTAMVDDSVKSALENRLEEVVSMCRRKKLYEQEYETYMKNIPEDHRLMKSINEALSALDSETVKVTLADSNGHELEFTAKRHMMIRVPSARDCGYPPAMATTNKDYQKVDRFCRDCFGSFCDWFEPHHIKQITYRKKIIWSPDMAE